MSESKVAPIAAKLRASVLQQAVEGGLVPQDPDDEPSSVLLERIQEERAELVKQKKAKAPRGGESRIYRGADGSWYEQRGKAEPVCIDKEIPLDIPENWEWSRLENITEYIQRGKSPKYSTIEKYPVVAQKCNQWSGFSLAKAKFIDPSTLSQYGIERFLITGDLLWNSTGLGTLGRIAIYDDTVNPYECAVADSHVTVIRTDARWMNYSFLFAYFAGPSVQRIIESQASGSTKQKELSLATVQNYLVPVPPISEQQRIVERINEIMPLIDRLEKLERESDAVDSRFWRDLPSSILQQAVEGKLVPQDPDDEPSSVLLECIRKERAELVKQKKAKAPKGGESRIYRGADGSWYEQRGKAEPVCIDKEIPFGIPDNWAWSRLIDCSEAIVDCPHSTPKYLNEDTGYYAIDTNCMDYGWNQTGSRNLSKAEYEARTAKLTPQPNDIVLSREASIGRAVILSDENYCLGQRVMLIRSGDNLDSRYLQLLFTSPYAWNLYRAMNQGTGVKHINVSAIRNMLIPVPPLAEQRRIATKVFEIRAMLANRFIASAA